MDVVRTDRKLVPLLLSGAIMVLALPAHAATPPASPLLDAARDDFATEVARQLRTRSDVNARDELGATPLAWAVVRNNVEVVRQLLAARADPNLADVNGVTPLALAVENNASEIAGLLLAARADPNLPRSNGETALMTAARTGSADAVRMLLEHGADPNGRETQFGQTALMWAAGHPDIVKMLVDKGANIRATTKTWDVKATIYTPITGTLGGTGIPWNHSGEYATKSGGFTPLIFAVQQADIESAKLLLAGGADVNAAAADGTTPLMAALFKWSPNGRQTRMGNGAVLGSPDLRYNADLAMANLLLDAGAKVNVANGTGHTPLHGAILGLVLSRPDGQTSLAYTSGGGGRRDAAAKDAAPPNDEKTLAIVQRLLAAGADPNRPTLYPAQGPVNAVRIDPIPPGSTPFHVAAGSHDARLVALLAEHGADPNRVRQDGHTPFSVAVMTNDLPVVQQMVAHGASLTQVIDPIDEIPDPVESKTQQHRRQTILHIAAAVCADQVIGFLAEKGTPMTSRNSLGETALDLADQQERYRYARANAGNRGVRRSGARESQTTTALQQAMLRAGLKPPPLASAAATTTTPRS